MPTEVKPIELCKPPSPPKTFVGDACETPKNNKNNKHNQCSILPIRVTGTPTWNTTHAQENMALTGLIDYGQVNTNPDRIVCGPCMGDSIFYPNNFGAVSEENKKNEHNLCANSFPAHLCNSGSDFASNSRIWNNGWAWVTLQTMTMVVIVIFYARHFTVLFIKTIIVLLCVGAAASYRGLFETWGELRWHSGRCG